MSNATRTKVAPSDLYVIATGHVLELAGNPAPWAPSIGATFRADHPIIQHWLANDGIEKGYIVPADEANEASLGAARQRAATGRYQEPVPDSHSPDPAAPRKMVRAIEPVKYLAGAVSGPLIGTVNRPEQPDRPIGVMSPPLPLIKFVEVGAIIPADDAIVAAFPQSFEPAEPIE